jgi:hypothetical protein
MPRPVAWRDEARPRRREGDQLLLSMVPVGGGSAARAMILRARGLNPFFDLVDFFDFFFRDFFAPFFFFVAFFFAIRNAPLMW